MLKPNPQPTFCCWPMSKSSLQLSVDKFWRWLCLAFPCNDKVCVHGLLVYYVRWTDGLSHLIVLRPEQIRTTRQSKNRLNIRVVLIISGET